MGEMILKLLQQIPEGINEVWIWGILPVYFLVYFLIGVLTLRHAGGAAMAVNIRKFRRRSVSELLRECLQYFYRGAAMFTVLAVLLPTFLYLNLKYDAVLVSLEANLSALCSMVIGLTTIVLTVSVVIILFHKNYYLVFTITDVLKSYHFTSTLGMLLVNCLGTCVCVVVSLYLTDGGILYKLVLLVLEWCILCCLATTAASFWIIYRVMFSNEKAELRLLNRLYRIYRGGEKPDDSQASPADTWSIAAVRTNVEYLCAEYVSAARVLPIHRVVNFTYLFGEVRRQTWNAIYRKALRMIIYGALGIWLISMLVVSFALGSDGTGLLLMNTIMLAVVTVPAMFGFRRHPESVELLFDDMMGYEMALEGGTHFRIPRMILRPAKKQDRFVRKMNSLTAFFHIALERGMRKEMTEEAIGMVIDWLSDVKEKHSCLYLPVFAAGYFAFAGGQEIDTVRTLYAALVGSPEAEPPEEGQQGPLPRLIGREMITGTGQDDFDQMLTGHLTDLLLSQGGDTAEAIASYLDWLHTFYTDSSADERDKSCT